MNRYKIRAQDGREFVYEANVLVMQPEWGKDPVIVTENIDAEITALIQKKTDKKAAIERLKAKNIDSINSVPELRAVVKDLVLALKLQ